MPQLLITILAAFASSLVAKLLLGAGLAFISYTFINDLVMQAQNAMLGLYNNVPADIMGIMGILKIPQALSVIMSAIGNSFWTIVLIVSSSINRCPLVATITGSKTMGTFLYLLKVFTIISTNCGV